MKRIVVISEDLVEPWDEGIKKFAFSVATALSDGNDVRVLNVDRSGLGGTAAERIPATRTFMNPALRRAVRDFVPDVVLYVPSPSSTVGSFVRAYSLRKHAPRAAHGMVALIPRRHRSLVKSILHGTAPDVLFVPSYASMLHYHQLALRTELTAVGVDHHVFHPVGADERERLRDKYGVGRDSYVYLHVGHLSPKRELDALGSLKSAPATDVLVVASTSTDEDRALRAGLETAGVRVIREYVPVEEFYRLADCYVFPVRDVEGCVEIPLSVLEALSSGLPVLTTPFGGLRDFLQPGDDLFYWTTRAELTAAAAEMRARPRPEVRDTEAFSWTGVAGKLLRSLTE